MLISQKGGKGLIMFYWFVFVHSSTCAMMWKRISELMMWQSLFGFLQTFSCQSFYLPMIFHFMQIIETVEVLFAKENSVVAFQK